MFPSQQNTVFGARSFVAAANLTGLEGYLVKLTSTGGVPQVTPLTALTDIPTQVLVDDGIAGAQVTIQPLDGSQEVRIVASGTGSTGQLAVIADPTVGANAGKVRALPNTPGVYVSVGEFEEDFVDGQTVLIRPALQVVRVISADSLTPLAFTTPTAAEVEAFRTAVLAILVAQGLVA